MLKISDDVFPMSEFKIPSFEPHEKCFRANTNILHFEIEVT